MRSYRIGIDTRLYSQTGVGRYTRFLIEELAKIDQINHYFLFVSKEDYDKVSLPEKNFSKHRVSIRWHTVAEQLIFPFILLKEKLDLVHFPYFSVPIFYPKPFIVTIHDLTPLTHATGKASSLPLPLYRLKQLGYRLVLSQAVSRACHIIVPSKATKRELITYFPKTVAKTTVTYEGVKKVRTTGDIIDQEYFLYIGNAYPHKNVEMLIKAFFKIKEETKLVLVGAEDFFYRRLKQKLGGGEKRIVFFGPADDTQLANLYSHALALVFPSLSEGFGLPVVEAMAYGCLVIASSIPALKEVCGEAAIYIDPLDETSITKAMQKVLEDRKQFNHLIRHGRNQAKLFRWQKMARQTLSVYEGCLSL